MKALDSDGVKVFYGCSSIDMRTVKVSTMLFSEDEPVVAAKLAMMDKTITVLVEGQKTLYTLLAEKLPNES